MNVGKGSNNILTNDELSYVAVVEDDLKSGVKHTKITLEKLAGQYGIENKNLVKELTELAIVRVARYIAHCKKCPDTGKEPTTREKFDRIVDLYNHQANLSQRTSESMLLQQYSTPAPIAYLAGAYCLEGQPENYSVFEPSAGNGLLTIAFEPSKVIVNEIDDIRKSNLITQGYRKVTSINGTVRFDTYIHDATYLHIDFDVVITNPPFGTIDQEITYGIKPDSFPIKTLDHLMALRALDLMKDNGKAAIIIGGHTKWDELNRVQAGKNRIFLNYLYRYYNVYDILQIDGHKLYSRQGTAFDVRLILIDGRKLKPEGAAPLKQPFDNVITDFDTLYDRVLESVPGHIMKLPNQETIHQDVEHPKSKERFSEVTTIPREQITTNAKLFQGRQTEFSNETVEKIVSEGYDKSQEPIIVWWDEDIKKYVVISGHSRWRASEILYKKGDHTLTMMPVKIFIGDRDDAIDYAVLESNRSSTAEGLMSDIKAYKRAVKSGYNREKLKGLFKPESYLNFLQDVSYLDEDGLFVTYLTQESGINQFPYLKRNASWIGNIRKQFPDLTDSHEKELFDFLYRGDKKNITMPKDRFFDLINRRLTAIDFDKNKPLNLSNIVSTSAYTDPVKEKIREVENDIEKLNRERVYKEDMIVKANQAGRSDLAEKFRQRVSEINKLVLMKIEEKQKLESSVSRINKEMTFDLFNPAPEKDDKLKLAKARAKALMLKLKLLNN